MGALIAGVALASLRADVIPRSQVRDFFVTPFFSWPLGLKCRCRAGRSGQALLIVIFVLASRVISGCDAYVLGTASAGTVTR
jgi:hypothetical protein